MVLVSKANTFKAIGLFLLILFLFAQPAEAQLSYACDAQTFMVENECEALVALYNSTFNLLDPWIDDTGWLGDPNPCSWFGVTCNGMNVSNLSLRDNKLDGPLPPEIGDLPFLTDLDLSVNNLTGSLPIEIQQLFSLINFNVSFNGFTGNLPSEISTLPVLQTLNIGHNTFSGELPASLGNLASLQTLDIGHNSFEGEIPSSFVDLTKLTKIDTTNNNLCLPDETVKDWYDNIYERIGVLQLCFIPDTETPTPVPDTLTPTPIPLPTLTPTITNTPTITLTPTMLGQFQTLTAFAYEDTLTATANWFRTPTAEVTATKYYILVSQTLVPGDEVPDGGDQDNDFPIPGEDDGGDISGLWWLLLIIPIGMIGAGIYLELRGRQSSSRYSSSKSSSDSSSQSPSKDDNDDDLFQTFLE